MNQPEPIPPAILAAILIGFILTVIIISFHLAGRSQETYRVEHLHPAWTNAHHTAISYNEWLVLYKTKLLPR